MLKAKKKDNLLCIFWEIRQINKSEINSDSEYSKKFSYGVTGVTITCALSHLGSFFARLYQVIRNHPSALEIYQKKLLESGKISKEDIDRLNKKVSTILMEEFKNSKDYVPNKRDWLSAYWTGFKSPEQISRIRNTG
jgi:hypothetical protein